MLLPALIVASVSKIKTYPAFAIAMLARQLSTAFIEYPLTITDCDIDISSWDWLLTAKIVKEVRSDRALTDNPITPINF